jgi:hypothetical protein
VSGLPNLRGVRRMLFRCGLVLLGVNVVVFLAFTLPRLLAERSLASRARLLEQEVARERTLLETEKRREQIAVANAQDVQRLYKTVLAPSRRGLVPTLEGLDRFAKEAGLNWHQETYRPTPVKGTPLVRMEITVPFSGLYSQIIDFLTKIERARLFFVVDQIQLRSRPDEAGDLSIELSAYFFGEEAK